MLRVVKNKLTFIVHEPGNMFEMEYSDSEAMGIDYKFTIRGIYDDEPRYDELLDYLDDYFKDKEVYTNYDEDGTLEINVEDTDSFIILGRLFMDGDIIDPKDVEAECFNNLFWVFHDIYHMIAHVSGCSIYVGSYEEMAAQKYAFRKMRDYCTETRDSGFMPSDQYLYEWCLDFKNRFKDDELFHKMLKELGIKKVHNFATR